MVLRQATHTYEEMRCLCDPLPNVLVIDLPAVHPRIRMPTAILSILELSALTMSIKKILPKTPTRLLVFKGTWLGLSTVSCAIVVRKVMH